MSAPTRAPAVYDEIATEFLRTYPRGARLLAVAAADPARSTESAAALAAALRGQGTSATVRTQDDRDEARLREEIAAPARAAGADAVTVVAGDAALLAGRTGWLWHSRVWLVAGDEEANTTADVLVDITDPGHPVRRFADFCQCDVG